MPYKDLEKRRQANRDGYYRNKTAAKERVKAYKQKLRRKWAAYKATLSCVNCGENHPAALDFHHVVRDETNRKICELLHNQAYLKVFEEIKKCIVLCANCHRKEHHNEREANKNQKSDSSP